MLIKKNGNQHYVISLMDGGIYADPLEQSGAHVYALEFPRGKINFKGCVRLFKLVRQIRPDVVQTWMYHADLIGGVVARLAGVRAIAWGIRLANLNIEHNKRSTLLVARVCALLSTWVPSKIICCGIQATLEHQALGYAADKFIKIPNGYSMEKFQPDVEGGRSVREEIGVDNGVFVVGMVARFNSQKNHRNLLQSLSMLKRRGVAFNCLLVGVGMDSSNTELRVWIAEAGLTDCIKLLGPRNDIPAVMAALDVHVLSSSAEGFPNVLAEAMACGTPCVTTDVGDAAVIVADHGWVVSPQDSEALADGLAQAYGQFSVGGAAWQARQAACRAHIMANFELELMCQRYRQAWQLCMQP